MIPQLIRLLLIPVFLLLGVTTWKEVRQALKNKDW